MLKILPNDPLCLFNLAQCALEVDQKDKARGYFKKGVESFEKESEQTLIQKFHLSEGNINFMKQLIKDFEELKVEIEEL